MTVPLKVIESVWAALVAGSRGQQHCDQRGSNQRRDLLVSRDSTEAAQVLVMVHDTFAPKYSAPAAEEVSEQQVL